MAQPRGDSFTRAPGFMSGPQMRPGMSRVSRVSASPCTQQPLSITTVASLVASWAGTVHHGGGMCADHDKLLIDGKPASAE